MASLNRVTPLSRVALLQLPQKSQFKPRMAVSWCSFILASEAPWGSSHVRLKLAPHGHFLEWLHQPQLVENQYCWLRASAWRNWVGVHHLHDNTPPDANPRRISLVYSIYILVVPKLTETVGIRVRMTILWWMSWFSPWFFACFSCFPVLKTPQLKKWNLLKSLLESSWNMKIGFCDLCAKSQMRLCNPVGVTTDRFAETMLRLLQQGSFFCVLIPLSVIKLFISLPRTTWSSLGSNFLGLIYKWQSYVSFLSILWHRGWFKGLVIYLKVNSVKF